MDDLISRRAAIDIVVFECGKWTGLAKEISKQLKKLPSTQPEITHCAECIHWKHSKARKNYCDVFDWVNKAEDFCSFAERRTDE